MAREMDRWSEVALYRQLAAILRDQIKAGELEPGQALPSESYLKEQHHLSRGTVKKALELLAEEGWTQLVRTRGSRVRPREEWPEQ